MPLPIDSGVITVRYTLSIDPDIMINTFGVNLTGDPDLTDLDAFLTSWRDNMGPNCSDVVKLDRCTIDFNTGSGDQIVEDDTQIGDDFGGSGGDVLPTMSAYIVSKSTALGGRKGRGRVFVPGVLESNTELNGVSSAARTAINSDLDTFISAFPFGSISGLAIIHSDGITAPTAVNALRVRTNLAVMRNRYQN